MAKTLRVDLICFDESKGHYEVPDPSPASLAFFRLRRPRGQHTEAEDACLRRHAADRRRAVEIGVAEGASALAIRSVLHPQGLLTLIDPYPPGAFFVNMSRLVAMRTVRRARGPHVRWMRTTSHDAVRTWTEPIDFLFIDGDHSYEACTLDLVQWAPLIEVGGVLILHDARLFPGGWTDRTWGSLRAVDELLRTGRLDGFEFLEELDSTVVTRRTS